MRYLVRGDCPWRMIPNDLKVVRKDLFLQVKRGTDVPSFVLEFLLARYCASDDPREIQDGLAAVLKTIQKSYVRPDESNRTQMLVQQNG